MLLFAYIINGSSLSTYAYHLLLDMDVLRTYEPSISNNVEKEAPPICCLNWIKWNEIVFWRLKIYVHVYSYLHYTCWYKKYGIEKSYGVTWETEMTTVLQRFILSPLTAATNI